MTRRICGTVAAVIALLSTPVPASALEAVAGPTLTMDPNGVTPLAGVVALTTDVPARIILGVSNGTESWGVELPGFRTEHVVPLLGLKPAETYAVRVVAIDTGGHHEVLSPVLYAVTDPLPADFPRISVYYSDPSRMEPGFTLLDRLRRGNFGLTEYSMILDHRGDVRWYSTLGGQDGMRQLPNGNLLLLDSSEMDLLGNITVRRIFDVPGLFLHHDLFPTQHGTFLSLSLEHVLVEGYPSSEVDPGAPPRTTQITSDLIVEFAADGSLVNQWHLADILDPRRIGYDSTKPGFPLYDRPDWSHSNAVIHDPRDDSIIVSVRHQDAVVKFSRQTGELIWILGPHANWGPEFQPYLLTPVGEPFEWQFHQHAPMLTPHGTLLLFDNGNYRASPFDGRVPLADWDTYSRAVEYAIDETTMEVRQVWEYGSALDWRLFSVTQGDADWMPLTGNVLMTLSDTRFMAGVAAGDWGFGYAHTAIIEVEYGSLAERVFDMRVYDVAPGSMAWSYRSERIPSLYAADVRIIHDVDRDGVLDDADNCTFVANASQRDTDGDRFGNICDPDLNNDGIVDHLDLFFFGELFQSADPTADFDGDGLVSWSDLEIMRSMWLSGPGPSGVHGSAP